MTEEQFVACHPPDISAEIPNHEYVGYDLPITLKIKNKMYGKITADTKVYAITPSKYIPIKTEHLTLDKLETITRNYSIKMPNETTTVILDVHYKYCRNIGQKKIQKTVYPMEPPTPTPPTPPAPTPPAPRAVHVEYSYEISKRKVKPNEKFTVTVRLKADNNTTARVTAQVEGLKEQVKQINLTAGRPRELTFEFTSPNKIGKKNVHIKIEREE